MEQLRWLLAGAAWAAVTFGGFLPLTRRLARKRREELDRFRQEAEKAGRTAEGWIVRRERLRRDRDSRGTAGRWRYRVRYAYYDGDGHRRETGWILCTEPEDRVRMFPDPRRRGWYCTGQQLEAQGEPRLVFAAAAAVSLAAGVLLLRLAALL